MSLIANFTTKSLSETLRYYIQQHTRLYISTGGFGTNSNGGGSWIIFSLDCIVIVSGWNPDFD